MRRFFEKYGKTITVLLVSIIGLVLIVSAVAMLSDYTAEVEERASSAALYRTLTVRQQVSDKLAENTAKATSLANALSDLSDRNEIYDYLEGIHGRQDYIDVIDVRYFRYDDESGKEVLCDFTDNVLDDDSDVSRDYWENESCRNVAGYVGSYDSDMGSEGAKMTVIGFYAPTPDSDFMDAVVIYFTRDKAESFFSSAMQQEDAEFSVLATSKGVVITGRESLENANLFDALRIKIGSAEPVKEAEALIAAGRDGTVLCKINAVSYMISVSADKQRMNDLAVVELYRVDKLCSTGLDFVHTIISIVLVFAVIAVIVVVYLMIYRRRLQRQVLDMETYDSRLECFNRHGFEKEARRILDRNKTSYFAVVALQLRHYKHLLETYGESETNNLLSYLRFTCKKTTAIEETFGHVESGLFLMLLHAKDRTGLLERLKIHSFLATQYKSVNKYDVLLKYGIYEIDAAESVTTTQMIDFANEANNTTTHATEQNAGMQFNFYNDELRKIRMINEDMELRMEGALHDGEFQVFYQPKYNLNIGRQDGSEALVRWYDPRTKQYNRPALFMELFETNGFIVKLDKYVYTKVCEYINYSIAQGRTVYPVSVNVSRITAVQPDFIEFYSKIKRKYGITDGQIMIEFTESFAYENYQTLRHIVDGLHKSGFKCSIDDFGCGYSSYRILKSLPMDEIKLDKFFLEDGDSRERDQAIFESIIELAKRLGMKVTQEGVESKEDIQRLIELGCDVIQGYVYSHPLSLSDYINFVASSRDHNLT